MEQLAAAESVWWRKAIDASVIVICTLAFSATVVGIVALLLTGNHPGGRDIVSFWAAGTQLRHHANPYDAAAVLGMERAAGFSLGDQALIMRNPPTALALVLPLGFLGLRAAALLWSVLLFACLAASVQMLWAMHGRPVSNLHLLGYTFGPALTCIFAGQSALFATFGLVLFLRFHRTQVFLAGAGLWLCGLKPHLLLAFGVVVLLWVLRERAYKLLLPFFVMLVISALLAAHFDPAVWAHYFRMMRTAGIEHEFMPCLSVVLCSALHSQSVILRYLPAALATAWAVFYFTKHRAAWDWLENGTLVALVSVLASPYAWLTDQSLMLPAILFAIYRSATFGMLELLALASAVIEGQLLFGVSLHSAAFVWTAPFWFAWLLLARGSNQQELTI